MMTDDLTVKCKKCGAVIKLTDALVAPLMEKERAAQAEGLADERRKMREEEKRTAEKEAAHTVTQANEVARNMAVVLGEANAALKEQDKKLAEAQKEQARLLAKERELDDARREMELTIARKVIAETGNIRQTVEREVEGQAALALAERDERLRSLTGQIEELKRRAEQGDNRVAGEAQEVVLERLLREKFPFDQITPVAKGAHGGDCLHIVTGANHKPAGSVLWESKRTKNWEDRWLGKLRDDMRAAGALGAVLVTQAMPRGVETFGLVDGVWVVRWDLAVPVAAMLRVYIIELAVVEGAREGQVTKAEAMYAYLTGPRFKARMQAVVERFQEMGDDLRKERAAMTRGWAKREEQIRGAVEAAAGCVGDVQGISGKVAVEIEALTLAVGDGK